MLYKFRSKASADVIMLAAHGNALVEAMGKAPGEAGTVVAAEAQATWSKLNDRLKVLAAQQKIENTGQTALKALEALEGQGKQDESGAAAQSVGEAQRWQPVMKMLAVCHSEQVPLVWTVG